MSNDAMIHDRADQQRFELPVGDDVAFVAYERDGDTLRLLHTEVPTSARGQGVGSRIIGAVLARVRERGEKVVPLCPAVVGYIDKHPDTRDLVVPG